MLPSKATRKNRTGRKAPKTVTTQVRTVTNVIKKRKGRKRQRTNGAARSFRNMVVRLSECADKYLIAATDPWHPRALNCCVPVPTGPTLKSYGYLRGTLQISNTGAGSGLGWILVSPSTANNTVQLITSSSAYARDDVNPYSGGGLVAGVIEQAVPTLPYPANFMIQPVDSKPLVASRVVACGLRTRFVGRAVDVGGLVYAIREPYHMSTQVAPDVLTRSTDIGSLGTRPQVVIRNLDRNYVTTTDFACDRREMELTSWVENRNEMASVAAAETKTLYPFSRGDADFWDEQVGAVTTRANPGVGTLVGIPTLLIMLRGEPGATVEYEYRVHVEYNGPPAAALASRNPSDPVGAERVQAAMQDVSQTGRMSTDPPATHAAAASVLGEMQKSLQENVIQPLAGYAATSAGALAAAAGGVVLERIRGRHDEL